jgi:acyl-CoA synthetase (AMP-forming)/AMP-acid ligase II
VILNLDVGDLCEPLTGRTWKGRTIPRRCDRRVAYYRSNGVGPSDLVFIHFGNTLEFFVDVLALWRLGACVAPIDPRLTPFEVETLARAAEARFSLWQHEPDGSLSRSLANLGARILQTPADDGDDGLTAASSWQPGALSLDADALVLFTSGTTGRPKGVVHTHRSLRARWMSLRAGPGVQGFRRTLCLLPTHFGHGLICNALFPWLSGQDLFVLPPFRADLILRLGALLDEHRITCMSSVPALWRLALKTAPPPRARSLQRVFCGSAPLSASLWQGIREWTGAPEVLNVYGITEVGSWLAGTTLPDFVPEDGLIGEAWGGVVTVLRSGDSSGPAEDRQACGPGEAGYVWVNTPALMRGYLGRDDLTAQAVSDGWFTTGDIGIIDERGRLYLRGREREEINLGGMKVYPGDIDAVLERFEDTVDVCAFGYDDAASGEEIGVALVLRTTDERTLRPLYGWARRHLAPHQLPRKWYLLDTIPRTSRGKVNRAAVAERCAGLEPVEVRRLSSPASTGTDTRMDRGAGGGDAGLGP